MELTEAPVEPQVKRGYKQTEVGVIPGDWGVLKLRSQCQVITKGTTPTSIGRNFQQNGINFIKAETLTEDGGIVQSKVAFIDEDTHRILGRSQLQENDVLFSIAGVLGRVGVVKSNLLPANTNQALAIIRLARGAKLDHGYLLRVLNSTAIKKHVEGINVQAAQANLSLENIGDFPLAVPPTEAEQRAIATALSDVDALLGSLDALIAKKKAIKQGTMQRLLTGKQRLNGFKGEWAVKRLGDMLTLRHGKPQHAVVKANGKYPILGTGGIMAWTDEYLYNKPSVMIGRKGTIDLPRYMDTPFWTVDTLFYSEIFDNADAKFLYYRFWLIDWYRYNESSGVPSMIASTVENIEVEVPKTKEEQTAIAMVLSDMDAELGALEARRAKTALLKQGMMQELLTGRTRLV